LGKQFAVAEGALSRLGDRVIILEEKFSRMDQKLDAILALLT